MNIKELRKYNRSRRQYHKLLAKELGRPIVNHILCKTRKIQGLYRLEANAAEEIEQELSIAAIKSRHKWTSDMAANKTTYMVRAVDKQAAYLGRQLSDLPIMENFEIGIDMRAIGALHKTAQENVRRIYDLNNSKYPPPVSTDKEGQMRQQKIQQKERPKIKPSVISCGSELAIQAPATSLCDNALKLDIEATMEKLTHRQREIVNMLEANMTHAQIAHKMGVRRVAITKAIKKIRQKFKKHKKAFT